jgi:hypothetical protein
MKFAPIISGIQKMALYETKAVLSFLLIFGHCLGTYILHFCYITSENLFSRFQQHTNEIPSAENRPDGTQIFGCY